MLRIRPRHGRVAAVCDENRSAFSTGSGGLERALHPLAMAGPRLRDCLVISMFLAVTLRGSGDVRAAELRGVHTAIVAGTPTSNEPSTGALLVGDDPAVAVSWCTAVLVGCQTVLTAAHCVCEGNGAMCQPPHAPL